MHACFHVVRRVPIGLFASSLVLLLNAGLAVVSPLGAAPVFEPFTTTDRRDGANSNAHWNTAAGRLENFPFSAPLTYMEEDWGNVVVAAAGEQFFTAGTNGIGLIGLSGPDGPWQGLYLPGSLPRAAVVSGAHAYVADEIHGLRVFHLPVSGPPIMVAQVAVPGACVDVAVQGGFAYVLSTSGGSGTLSVVDVSTPPAAFVAGSCVLPAGGNAIAIGPGEALVASGAAGVQRVSVANPAAPVLGTMEATSGPALDIAVVGKLSQARAYVLESPGLLEVFDAYYAWTLVGSLAAAGPATSITIDGGLAVLSGGGTGIEFVDIRQPGTPVRISTIATTEPASRTALAADRMLVSPSSSFGPLEFRRRATALHTPVLQYALPDQPVLEMARSGDLVFNLDWATASIQAWRVTPTGLTTAGSLGSYSTPAYAQDIAVSGSTVCVAGFTGLHVVDASNLPSMVHSGTIPGTYVTKVGMSGSRAYMLDNGVLSVVDVSNPYAPVNLGSYGSPYQFQDVRASGSTVYATSNTTLQVLDASNPAAITPVTSFNLGAFATGIELMSDYALVSCNDGVHVVDLRAPIHHVSLLPGYATDVSTWGRMVYVATQSEGLLAYDLGTPASPVLEGRLPSTDYLHAVVAFDDRVAVSDLATPTRVYRTLQNREDDSRNRAQSVTLYPIPARAHSVAIAAVQTGPAQWEVTADGGAHWQVVPADGAQHLLDYPGTDLRWRVRLWAGGPDGPGATWVDDVTLTFLFDGGDIRSIRDVKNDQGRQVRIAWGASFHDSPGDTLPVTQYAIYRQIDPLLAAAARPKAAAEGASAELREDILRMAAAGWDFVGQVPAYTDSVYAVVVPTLADSTIASGLRMSTFRVTALTSKPSVFYHTAPDSGYSVDNLTPQVPTGLALARVGPTSNALSWNPSPSADFQHFRIYRSPVPDFTPSPGTLVHSTTANSWTDASATGSAYYALTAVDFSGNESGVATAGFTLDAGAGEAPAAFRLAGAGPSPFRHSTSITFAVPREGGRVRLAIYDVHGRIVRMLADGPLPAGVHTEMWNGRDASDRPAAAGLYLVRFEAPGTSATRKVMLVR